MNNRWLQAKVVHKLLTLNFGMQPLQSWAPVLLQPDLLDDAHRGLHSHWPNAPRLQQIVPLENDSVFLLLRADKAAPSGLAPVLEEMPKWRVLCDIVKARCLLNAFCLSLVLCLCPCRRLQCKPATR